MGLASRWVTLLVPVGDLGPVLRQQSRSFLEAYYVMP